MKVMTLRTPLKNVRALGSAKEGTHHWWAQRVTAMALVPLTLWFVYSVLSFAAGDYQSALAWAAAPTSTVMLLMLVVLTFHHSQLGLQVVIEDYVHGELSKTVSLLASKFLNFALGVTGCVAILKIAFGG